MKKMMALLLAVVMVCGMLAACGGKGNADAPADNQAANAPAAGNYQVKVIDAFGNPVTSGVIVRYMQNGQQVSMQVVNEEGIVTKDLADGEYTVELQRSLRNGAGTFNDDHPFLQSLLSGFIFQLQLLKFDTLIKKHLQQIRTG